MPMLHERFRLKNDPPQAELRAFEMLTESLAHLKSTEFAVEIAGFNTNVRQSVQEAIESIEDALRFLA